MKNNNIEAIIAEIKISEGDKFEVDFASIAAEYKKKSEGESNLSLKLLSIFGGILASLAIIGFLTIAGLYNSDFGLITFGLLFIASAIWINKITDKLVIDTFSISIYLIGFALLSFAFIQLNMDKNIVSLIFIIIASSTILLCQNYILTLISILIINGGFLVLITLNESYIFVHLYISIIALLLSVIILNEAYLITYNKKISKLYNPFRIGLIISFLMGLIFVGIKGLAPLSIDSLWLSSVITISIILYLITSIIRIIGIINLNEKILIYILSTTILFFTSFSPAITGSVLLVLLCFLVNYKTGFSIGILSVIYFTSQYYYDLNLTLLLKSIILFATGILFLLFYMFTRKRLSIK